MVVVVGLIGDESGGPRGAYPGRRTAAARAGAGLRRLSPPATDFGVDPGNN